MTEQLDAVFEPCDHRRGVSPSDADEHDLVPQLELVVKVRGFDDLCSLMSSVSDSPFVSRNGLTSSFS